jgi:phage terminase large subunit
MFQNTTAIRKMRAMKARKKVAQGGTGAGKTNGILPIIADVCIKNPRLKATICAETIPAVKDGPVDIFHQFMQETGRWNDSRWLGNPMQYTFGSGSRMQFKAFDTVGKAKSAGKRDILFLNEANNIPFDIADALMTRSNDIWIDFNPDNEFWVHTETMTEPNSEMVILTYLDNEALPPQILEEINIKRQKAAKERASGIEGYWCNWERVYVFGEIGSLSGAIFNNWTQIDEIPLDAKLLRHGLDFGFDPDPMGCVTLFTWNGHLIIRENFYRTKMGISELIAACKLLEPADIMCDNSNPMLIAELQKSKLRAKPCIKGKDSVQFGISKLQEQKILIPKYSMNLINELRKYINDPITGLPIDAYNHLIDPTRYAYITEPVTTSSRSYARNDKKVLN